MKIYTSIYFADTNENLSIISVGVIDENNREFYAEFIDYSEPDKYAIKNIIPNLVFDKPPQGGKGRLKTTSSKHWMCGGIEFICEQLEMFLVRYELIDLYISNPNGGVIKYMIKKIKEKFQKINIIKYTPPDFNEKISINEVKKIKEFYDEN